MSVLARTVRRPLWLVLVWLLGAPLAAQASPAIVADFDGDGQRDRAELVASEPASVRIYLSGTHKIAVIRSATPILGLAARDLDGDKRDELIARGSSTRLQVWTQHHNSFGKFHARHNPSRSRAGLNEERAESGPAESALDPDSAPSYPLALSTITPRTSVSPNALVVLVRQVAGHASPVIAPLGSRPPPSRS